MIVLNKYDVEIDFDSATNMMFDKEREELHNMSFENEQDFFDAYCVLHEEKYGEEPEFGKETPVW